MEVCAGRLPALVGFGLQALIHPAKALTLNGKGWMTIIPACVTVPCPFDAVTSTCSTIFPISDSSTLASLLRVPVKLRLLG